MRRVSGEILNNVQPQLLDKQIGEVLDDLVGYIMAMAEVKIPRCETGIGM